MYRCVRVFATVLFVYTAKETTTSIPLVRNAGISFSAHAREMLSCAKGENSGMDWRMIVAIVSVSFVLFGLLNMMWTLETGTSAIVGLRRWNVEDGERTLTLFQKIYDTLCCMTSCMCSLFVEAIRKAQDSVLVTLADRAPILRSWRSDYHCERIRALHLAVTGMSVLGHDAMVTPQWFVQGITFHRCHETCDDVVVAVAIAKFWLFLSWSVAGTYFTFRFTILRPTATLIMLPCRMGRGILILCLKIVVGATYSFAPLEDTPTLSIADRRRTTKLGNDHPVCVHAICDARGSPN